jgi:hypothetical protein
VADEISGGDRPPRRGRTVLFVLIGVIVAVAAVTSLRRGVDPPALPRASNGPSQLPAPPGVVPPPTPVLALGDVCRPVTPSSPVSLAVSFTLRNNSAKPVRLTAVSPNRPEAGLKERGYTIRAGSCPPTGTLLTDNRLGRARPVVVRPASFVVATLYFELPDECPTPYPVQAVVSEQADAAAPTIDTDYTLLSDLGGVSFPNC